MLVQAVWKKILFSKHNVKIIWFSGLFWHFCSPECIQIIIRRLFCEEMTSISSKKFWPWIKNCDIYTSIVLTLKHRETHGCAVALWLLMPWCYTAPGHQYPQCWLKLTFIILDQFHIKILHKRWTASENEITFWKKLDESTARRHLKSPRSLSGRSLHLTLVTKWSRSHMTLKIQISMSWPRSNPLPHLRPRVQIDMFAFCFVVIGPLLVEI